MLKLLFQIVPLKKRFYSETSNDAMTWCHLHCGVRSVLTQDSWEAGLSPNYGAWLQNMGETVDRQDTICVQAACRGWEATNRHFLHGCVFSPHKAYKTARGNIWEAVCVCFCVDLGCLQLELFRPMDFMCDVIFQTLHSPLHNPLHTSYSGNGYSLIIECKITIFNLMKLFLALSSRPPSHDTVWTSRPGSVILLRLLGLRRGN